MGRFLEVDGQPAIGVKLGATFAVLGARDVVVQDADADGLGVGDVIGGTAIVALSYVHSANLAVEMGDGTSVVGQGAGATGPSIGFQFFALEDGSVLATLGTGGAGTAALDSTASNGSGVAALSIGAGVAPQSGVWANSGGTSLTDMTPQVDAATASDLPDTDPATGTFFIIDQFLAKGRHPGATLDILGIGQFAQQDTAGDGTLGVGDIIDGKAVTAVSYFNTAWKAVGQAAGAVVMTDGTVLTKEDNGSARRFEVQFIELADGTALATLGGANPASGAFHKYSITDEVIANGSGVSSLFLGDRGFVSAKQSNWSKSANVDVYDMGLGIFPAQAPAVETETPISKPAPVLVEEAPVAQPPVVPQAPATIKEVAPAAPPAPDVPTLSDAKPALPPKAAPTLAVVSSDGSATGGIAVDLNGDQSALGVLVDLTKISSAVSYDDPTDITYGGSQSLTDIGNSFVEGSSGTFIDAVGKAISWTSTANAGVADIGFDSRLGGDGVSLSGENSNGFAKMTFVFSQPVVGLTMNFTTQHSIADQVYFEYRTGGSYRPLQEELSGGKIKLFNAMGQPNYASDIEQIDKSTASSVLFLEPVKTLQVTQIGLGTSTTFVDFAIDTNFSYTQGQGTTTLQLDPTGLFDDEGGRFANGVEKLAATRDANGDGLVAGAEMANLGLWVDDGDAVVEAGEVADLSLRDIQAFDTTTTPDAAGLPVSEVQISPNSPWAPGRDREDRLMDPATEFFDKSAAFETVQGQSRGFTTDGDYLGSNQADSILQLAGDNFIFAMDGDDVVAGATGDDSIYGGTGNDNLQGGDGFDLLDGGKGNDVLKGGTGIDVFVFRKGDGICDILDFELSLDILDLEGFDNLTYQTLTAAGQQVGDDVFYLVGPDLLILRDVELATMVEIDLCVR